MFARNLVGTQIASDAKLQVRCVPQAKRAVTECSLQPEAYSPYPYSQPPSPSQGKEQQAAMI